MKKSFIKKKIYLYKNYKSNKIIFFHILLVFIYKIIK